jgi:hypothetical protein
VPIHLPILLLGCRAPEPCPGSWLPATHDAANGYPFTFDEALTRYQGVRGTWTWPDGSTAPAHLDVTWARGQIEQREALEQCRLRAYRGTVHLGVRTDDGGLDVAVETEIGLTWNGEDDPIAATALSTAMIGIDDMRDNARPPEISPEILFAGAIFQTFTSDDVWRIEAVWAGYDGVPDTDVRHDTGSDDGTCAGCLPPLGNGQFTW